MGHYGKLFSFLTSKFQNCQYIFLSPSYLFIFPILIRFFVYVN
ncbi:unnamed protein product [Brassica rapa]|uniref:Uncharacterized protein n=1 Tax=Brassica campestris TaxID=3711 RepID=A0A8D9GX99_BRACM|nr:unnamed protein product [Brassica rapa]